MSEYERLKAQKDAILAREQRKRDEEISAARRDGGIEALERLWSDGYLAGWEPEVLNHIKDMAKLKGGR